MTIQNLFKTGFLTGKQSSCLFPCLPSFCLCSDPLVAYRRTSILDEALCRTSRSHRSRSQGRLWSYAGREGSAQLYVLKQEANHNQLEQSSDELWPAQSCDGLHSNTQLREFRSFAGSVTRQILSLGLLFCEQRGSHLYNVLPKYQDCTTLPSTTSDEQKVLVKSKNVWKSNCPKIWRENARTQYLLSIFARYTDTSTFSSAVFNNFPLEDFSQTSRNRLVSAPKEPIFVENLKSSNSPNFSYGSWRLALVGIIPTIILPPFFSDKERSEEDELRCVFSSDRAVSSSLFNNDLRMTLWVTQRCFYPFQTFRRSTPSSVE